MPRFALRAALGLAPLEHCHEFGSVRCCGPGRRWRPALPARRFMPRFALRAALGLAPLEHCHEFAGPARTAGLVRLARLGGVGPGAAGALLCRRDVSCLASPFGLRSDSLRSNNATRSCARPALRAWCGLRASVLWARALLAPCFAGETFHASLRPSGCAGARSARTI